MPSKRLLDDLRILGDQLTEDAVHLASLYPAPPHVFKSVSDRVPPAVSGSGARFFWPRMAAAVALMLFGAAATVAVVAWHPWRAAEVAIAQPDRPVDVAPHREVASGSPSNRHLQSNRLTVGDLDDAPRPGVVRELSFDSSVAARSDRSELEMLRIQLTAFEQVIRKLQDELDRRQKSQAETDKLVESLHQEIVELRRQIESREKAEMLK